MARTPRWQPPLTTESDETSRVEYLPGQARRRPPPLGGSSGDEEPARRPRWQPPESRGRTEHPSLFDIGGAATTLPAPAPEAVVLDLRARWLSLVREAGWERGRKPAQLALTEARARGLELRAGVVEAGVAPEQRGKRPERVQLKWPELGESDWTRVASRLIAASDALPAETDTALSAAIVEALDAEGLRLWPRHLSELVATCTCGGGRVPCDHVLAVHLSLARATGERPALLLSLRGGAPSVLRSLADKIASERRNGALSADDGATLQRPIDPTEAPAPLRIDWSALETTPAPRPLLPSPPGWRATESLDAMVRRLLSAR